MDIEERGYAVWNMRDGAVVLHDIHNASWWGEHSSKVAGCLTYAEAIALAKLLGPREDTLWAVSEFGKDPELFEGYEDGD